MSALQARLVLFAFVGLTLAISYNAIFLQKGRHPAPMTGEAAVAPTVKPPVRQVPPRAVAPPSAPASASIAADTVRAIQRELAGKGYDPGAADGVLGLATRAEIMAYQHDHGLPVTGLATPQLLQHVVLGPGGAGAPSEVPVPPETVALVKGVQQRLGELGYGPGPVDGVLGAATRKAIEAFERERGMTPKGRVSGQVVRELMRVSGDKLPVSASDG